MRTEKGRIFKTDGDLQYLSNDKKTFYRILTRIPHETANYKVIKSSPNIIDLIEVGDYVNGCRVNDVYSPDGKNVFRIELEVDGLKGHIISKSKNIKSIVTKESFENISYKVGE